MKHVNKHLSLNDERKLIRVRFCAFIYLILLNIPILWAQSLVNKGNPSDLRVQLDQMFGKLDRKIVPTGFLLDYAEEYESLSKFSPTNGKNVEQECDLKTYVGLVETLRSAYLYGNPFETYDKIYKNRIKSSQDGRINICALSYDYAQIKANALKDGSITYTNGIVKCNNPKAFQVKNVTAGSILQNVCNTNNITFYYHKDLALTNTGIRRVEVDYGKGFIDVYNSSANAKLQNGRHKIRIKIIASDGNASISTTWLDVIVDNNLNKTRASLYTQPMQLSIMGDAYRGISTKADVTIIPSKRWNGKISKPFIFVEGFDPRLRNNTVNRLSYVSAYYKDWNDFVKNNDYDFIYVDWNTPEQYIQANAYTLIKVIETINNMSDENSSPTLLVGHSMGGLVARYALKTMENKSEKHNVGTYVSYDSPHLGANVPMGLLHGFYGIRKFLHDKKLIDKLINKFVDVSDMLSLGEKMAFSTAAQQMLCNSIDAAGHLNNSLHIQWQEELDKLGFPNGDRGKQFQMLGISNSDYNTAYVPKSYISANGDVGSFSWVDAFSPITGIALGVSFEDIILGLITALPGRTSADLTFECLPGTSVGQRVNNIKISFEKDFLWTIPITKSVFKYEGYYNSNFLYDTYPSSVVNYLSTSKGDNVGGFVPYIGYAYAAYGVSGKIPFIPASSALAHRNPTSTQSFMKMPSPSESAFGGNVFMESNEASKQHMVFSKEAQNWILSQITQVIDGPSFGYSGAKYMLKGISDGVSWSVTDPSIGTIDQNGVLTVLKIGVFYISCRYNGITYSKAVYVGMPNYILSSSHEPNGFLVEAKSFGELYKNDIDKINEILTFRWGVKFPNQNIYWIDTNSPSVFVPLDGKNAVVYLKVVDLNGNESPIQNIKCEAKDVFYASNNRLLMDKAQKLYKDDGTPYSYKYGKIYLTRDASLPDQYQSAIWTSTKATVYSPFSSTYTIPVSRGEMSIKDILPQEEMNFITSNTPIGKSCLYTIALLNPEDKFIQFIPVTVSLK